MTLTIALSLLCSATTAPEPNVLVDWDLRSAECARQWKPGADVIESAATPEGLRIKTRATDPILLSPDTHFVPGPFQVLEITYRCPRGGAGELFWAHDRSGPYDGFSGTQRRDLMFAASDGPRVMRVWPFWQGKPEILQVRIDPPWDCEMVLERVRVLDYTPPESPAWDGGLAPAYEVLTPLQDAEIGDRGVRVTGPEPLLVTRPLRGLAPLVRWLGLDFGGDPPPGEWRVGWVSPDAPGWHESRADVRGTKRFVNALLPLRKGLPEGPVRVVLAPSTGAQEVMPLSRLGLGTDPLGPPSTEVVWLGSRDAIARAGREERVLLRLSNPSSPPAQAIEAVIEVPDGLVLLGPSRRAFVSRLDTGETADVEWRVRASRAGSYPLSVRLAAPGVEAREIAADVAFSDPPTGLAPGRVPTPIRLATDYDIGVYYFPGWDRYQAWQVLDRYPERYPMLGYYDEADPETMDWQLLWAAERGVRFFAFDWYWNRGARQLEHGIDAYLRSRNRSAVGFCLLWANHNPPGTSSLDDLQAVTQFWIDHYFREPGYYAIDGRPVVIIFTPDRLREDMGAEAVASAFEQMRALCRSRGVPPVYLLACTWPASATPGQMKAMGYDAITTYNWAGVDAGGVERLPAEQALRTYAKGWRTLTGAGVIPLLPPVFGGWDPRPWHGDRTLVYTGRTPALFEEHLRDVKRFLDESQGIVPKTAIIEAWNEWGEGSYIAPHREFGFEYLDAIARVFGRDPGAPRIVLPKDVGLGPYELPVPEARTSWEMDGPGEGWKPMMDVGAVQWVDGELRLTTTGPDPAISGPGVHLATASYPRLRIRMASDADGMGQFFWQPPFLPMSEDTSVRFPLVGDGVARDYVLDLSRNPLWTGIVRQIRFDPIERSGAHISIDRVEFLGP